MAITGKANGLNKMMTICSHTDVLLPTKRPLLLFLYTYTATQEIIQYATGISEEITPERMKGWSQRKKK